jgi:hypothetical protein
VIIRIRIITQRRLHWDPTPIAEKNVQKNLVKQHQMNQRRVTMPKDSQPDNKNVRKEKANGQTPITQENQNQSNNKKKR